MSNSPINCAEYESLSRYRKVRDSMAIGAYLGGSILNAVGTVEHSNILIDLATASMLSSPVIAIVGRIIAPKPPQEPNTYDGIG